MARLPAEMLAEIARKLCDEAMKDLLSVPTSSEVTTQDEEWDPFIRRNVFQQDAVVWRDFDKIEVHLDQDSQVVGFRDHNRLNPADVQEYTRLADDDILAIAETTGVVGLAAEVERAWVGPKNLLLAIIVQPEDELPERMTFTIDPQRRIVAAFEVGDPS